MLGFVVYIMIGRDGSFEAAVNIAGTPVPAGAIIAYATDSQGSEVCLDLFPPESEQALAIEAAKRQGHRTMFYVKYATP